MSVNYAEKYSSKIDEHFNTASLTQNAFNQDYDWEGVSTVHVYSIATAELKDYSMTGGNRYGTPEEISSTAQTMTLSQDKCFTFTIDRRNYSDSMGTLEAGAALRRQVDEVVIPTVDKYRIAQIIKSAGTTSAPGAITGGKAYEAFLTGVTALLNNSAPVAGTFAFVSTSFYKQIRLDEAFIKSSDVSQNMLAFGQVGMIENIPLIYLPSGYFPAGVEFVLANRAAACAPVKLSEFKVHDNPPGINGFLVEGRVYYDAFVLNNKAKGIYVHKSV